jgi:hypothetical protein
MEEFYRDFVAIAPAVGRGDHAFRPDGKEVLGFIQIIPGKGRRIQIHRFWTREHGKGHGRVMLKALCELADKHGVELQLKALPIGRKPFPMTRDQLYDWYKRYGFEGKRGNMVRPPVKAA